MYLGNLAQLPEGKCKICKRKAVLRLWLHEIYLCYLLSYWGSNSTLNLIFNLHISRLQNEQHISIFTTDYASFVWCRWYYTYATTYRLNHSRFCIYGSPTALHHIARCIDGHLHKTKDKTWPWLPKLYGYSVAKLCILCRAFCVR